MTQVSGSDDLRRLADEIRDYIRELRSERRMTPNDLEKRMRGWPYAATVNIESGGLPSAQQLDEIFAILGAPPERAAYLKDRRDFLEGIEHWRESFSSRKPAAVLADLLTYYRRSRYHTVEEAASRVDLPALMLGSYESAMLVPEKEDLEKLLELYRVPDAERNLARALLNDTSPSSRATGMLARPRFRPSGTSGPAPAGIFLSYRRSDEPAFAGRLYDRIEAKFGHERVFMDVDSIEMGVNFLQALERALSRCAVLIAIIGKRWLTETDASGRRRLHRPDDVVRMEIEVALAGNILVIPVLVDGATMPSRTDLPESLASLTYRNGYQMSNTRFGADYMELQVRLNAL